MTKIYNHRRNSNSFKKYRIQEKDGSTKWLEITIDNNNHKFECQKVSLTSMSIEWEIYSDFTFPSSLLNHFIQNGEWEKDEFQKLPGDNNGG